MWRGAPVAIKKLLVVMDEALLAQEVRREATMIQYVKRYDWRTDGGCIKIDRYI